MIPDEEANVGPEQSHAPPARGLRRSHRGGRRHSRRRGGRGPARRIEEGEARPEAPAPVQEAGAERTPEPQAAKSTVPPGSAVGQAIEQVNQVIEELKRVVDQMEEVLETLELAERQKIDDEREIEELQRALRKLHRPGHTGPQRHSPGHSTRSEPPES